MNFEVKISGGTGANIFAYIAIERQLPSEVAHYLFICGKNNDCDMNDAQLDCAPNTTHFFPNSNLKQTVSGFSISDVVKSFGINYVSKKQTRSNYTISSF